MGKPPTFGAECLEQFKSASLAVQVPITVFTGLPAYNHLAVLLQGTDAIFFKQSKMKPHEVLTLVNNLLKILEKLHKTLRRAVPPKELEAAASLRSTSKLTLSW